MYHMKNNPTPAPTLPLGITPTLPLGVGSAYVEVKSKAPALQSKARTLSFLVLLLFSASFITQANTTLAPENLRTNLLAEGYNIPIEENINLSWIFRDSDQDEIQTAYQVEVGTSSDGTFSAYTSGWVNTPILRETIALIPANTLQGNTLYYWRVQTRDKEGAESEWSAPIPFVTGMAGNGHSADPNGWTNVNAMWLGAAPAPAWSDITIETDLIIQETAVGITFRDSNASNRYMWQFRTDNNRIVPHAANDGGLGAVGEHVNLSTKGITLTAGTKFRVKIQVAGSNPVNITTWIDTTPDSEETDYVQVDIRGMMATRINTPGRFGFRTGGTESGKVDWLKVTGSNDELIYENDFSNPTPMEFTGANISGGYLNIIRGLGNDCRYTPTSVAIENNNFVFFRRAFNLTQPEYDNIEKAVLALTGRGTENNALKSYYIDTYINGKPVGVGPAREPRNADGHSIGQFYNSFDITTKLQSGENVLAAQAFSFSEKTALFQLTLFHKDGTRTVLINSGADPNTWKAKDGTAAFGDNGGIFKVDGNINQPYENMNGTAYPTGWNNTGFTEDESWRAPKGDLAMNLSASRKLIPYTAENTLRFEMPAVSVNTITGSGGKTFQVVDLGKLIIGSLQLTINNPTDQPIALTVQMGESLIKPVDRTNVGGTTNYNAADAPYQTVRYDGWDNCPSYNETWTLKPGLNILPAFLMKNFRYVQFVDAPIEITANMVMGMPTRQAFDETAAIIESDNNFISRLVELCRYSILATNQDQYTDSQYRERRAYEGDMILNQYNSYAVSDNYALARHTNQYLIDWPTWPPEYKLFSVEMAWADYLYTGNDALLTKNYTKLQRKLPTTTGTGNNHWNTEMGLIVDDKTPSGANGALVDWPTGEQDGYVRGAGTSYTTVYNAVAHGAYNDMARIAALLEHDSDEALYLARAATIKENMIAKLYNAETGAFDDAITNAGATTGHYSQHATFYALAYGIYTDQAMADKMVTWLKNDIETRGLKPSVYGMYFLLRGLYNAGAGELANSIMLQEDPSVVRSWAHMLDVQQATITTEAWSPDNKQNMTYSHPWGGTPGTLITQGIFGIRPLEANFNLFQIKFQPEGKLRTGNIKSPSPKGPISASFTDSPIFKAQVTIPANSRAIVSIPAGNTTEELENGATVDLKINGERVEGTYADGFLTVELGSGQYEIMPYTESAIHVSVSVEEEGVIAWQTPFTPEITVVDEYGTPIALTDVNLSFAFAAGDFTDHQDGSFTANDILETTLTVTATKGALTNSASTPIAVFDPAEPVFTITAALEYNTPALAVGFPANLIVTPTPVPSEPVVTAESNNPAIATYNEDGTLNLLSAGSTTFDITMSSRGRSATYTIPVTIMNTPPQANENYTNLYIQLGDDPDKTTANLGEAAPLASLVYIAADGSTGTVTEGNTITSDDATISIENNLVTPITVGSATLKNANASIFDKLSPLFDANRIRIPNPDFSEDFSSGNTFINAWGSTAVADGSLYVGTGSGTNRYYTEGTAWTDYALLVNARAINGPISLTFRHDGNNFYYWQFFPADNTIKKQKCTNGNFTMIDGSSVDSPRSPIFGLKTDGQPNEIMIAAEGNRIMTYINGYLVDITNDDSFSAGSVGVRTGNAEVEPFYLDDIVIGTRSLITTRDIQVADLTAMESPLSTGKIYAEKGKLHITGYTSGTPVFIYNVLGQTIANLHTTSDDSTISLSTGAYIVQVILNGKEKTEKIIIE